MHYGVTSILKVGLSLGEMFLDWFMYLLAEKHMDKHYCTLLRERDREEEFLCVLFISDNRCKKLV